LLQHIELVRHWPRESVVGASGVSGKSWSRERFDSSITGSTDGSSAAADDAESTASGCVASPGKRDLEESGEENGSSFVFELSMLVPSLSWQENHGARRASGN
jgi:hypothetical protein